MPHRLLERGLSLPITRLLLMRKYRMILLSVVHLNHYKGYLTSIRSPSLMRVFLHEFLVSLRRRGK